MKKTHRLLLGDTVALVNPAGMPPMRFRKYVPLMERYLWEEGFEVLQYLAEDEAHPEKLAEIFMEAWADPRVKAVFPICGSPLIFEVLQYLEVGAFKQRQVLFCGSSVLSALSVWLTQRADLVSFFGPHLSFLHTYAPQRENEFSIQSFWSMVMWRKGRTKRISSPHERHHFFGPPSDCVGDVKVKNIYTRSGLIKDERRRDALFFSFGTERIEGKTFCITLGAFLEMKRRGLLLDISGTIVFTETMDWRLEQVETAFKELSSAEIFRGVKAVFLTTLTERSDRQEKMFPELRDLEKLKSLCQSVSQMTGTPILYGFPLGHGAYKMTLPQSILCEVNSADGSLFLKEVPVL